VREVPVLGEVLGNKNMDRNIYKEAVDTWGEDAQIMQTIQELAELIKELTDLKREGRTDAVKLAEEIIDCEMMINQMKYLFSKKYPNFEEIYQNAFIKKHEKVKKYLDKSSKN
jgi:hypothetical protein